MNKKEWTLEEYKDALKHHDWYYEMSDDPAIYKAGKYNHDILVKLSKKSKEFEDVFLEVKNKKLV